MITNTECNDLIADAADNKLITNNSGDFLITNIDRLEKAVKDEDKEPSAFNRLLQVCTTVSVIGGVLAACYDIGEKLNARKNASKSAVKENTEQIR